jgi:hypothetical protein
VPECDSPETKFNEDWVKDVLPGSFSESSGKFVPEFCTKFVYNNNSVTNENKICPASWFGDKEERCDRWVFDETERTIVNDVRQGLHFKKHHRVLKLYQ